MNLNSRTALLIGYNFINLHTPLTHLQALSGAYSSALIFYVNGLASKQSLYGRPTLNQLPLLPYSCQLLTFWNLECNYVM
jgi:hypothetical protein